MQLFNVLDFYPCGAYKLTKSGKQPVCKLYNNISFIGAGNNQLNQLFTKGYIDNTQRKTVSVEHFSLNKNNYDILVLFLILFLIFIL